MTNAAAVQTETPPKSLDPHPINIPSLSFSVRNEKCEFQTVKKKNISVDRCMLLKNKLINMEKKILSLVSVKAALITLGRKQLFLPVW